MDWAVSTGMTLHDGVSATFKRMAYGADHFGDAADHAFKKASHSSSRFGDIVKGVLTADLLKSGARALWDIGVSSIKLASDLTEVQNVVDTTFKADAGAINAWSKSAITAFGLSELQAKQMTGTLGSVLKASGVTGSSLVTMTENLTGLAGDLASFKNLDPQEAFQKIQAGIVGEIEPLRSLGYVMSVTNLQAFALTQGIHKQWKAMTQAEQVQLRYNYLMKVSKDAQGDFHKTLKESFANQQRVLKTRLEQAGATIMTGFLPLLTNAFAKINDALANIDFDKITRSIQAVVPYVVFVATAIGTLAYWLYVVRVPLMAVITAFAIYKTIMTIATIATSIFNAVMLANPMTWVVIGVYLLIAAIATLAYYWQDITNFISGAFNSAISTASHYFDMFANIVSNVFKWFDSLAPSLKNTLMIIFPMIGAVYLLWKYWDKIVGAVKGFLGIQDQVSKATPKVKVSNETVATATKNVSGPPSMGGAMGMSSISGGGAPQLPSRAQIAAPTPESMTQKMKLEFYGRIDVVGLPEGSKFTRTGGNAPAIDVKMLGENK